MSRLKIETPDHAELIGELILVPCHENAERQSENVGDRHGEETAYGPGDVRSWILPIISLALPSIASLMLWTRRYVVDQMNSDYVKFAKAKGLNQREIFSGHIFKNAVIPIAQGIPASLAACITGAIITESIYSVGGMGKMLPNAINQYNNVMIVALAFIFSTVSVLSVLAGDIVLTKVDPRISLSEKAGRS